MSTFFILASFSLIFKIFQECNGNVVPGVREHEGAEDLYLYLLFLRR
jgi:hypothetical protein